MPSKSITIFKHGRCRQHGAALLIMLVILVVGITAVLLNSLTSSSLMTARQKNTAAALAQAKSALIGYAITYADTHSNTVPGYLPCPDQTGGANEGSAAGSCGSQDISQMGRLPWKTLDLSTLRDGDGECLWYAVSGTYKNNPKTGLMNWDTNGQLQVYSSDGTQLASQVVAVIFAPGAALLGQDRSGTTAPVCGGNYTVTNYLDNDTVHSINNTDIATGKFIQGTSGGSVNDQMVFITRQDIWNTVQKRTDFQPTNPNNPLILLTQQVALCLANYGNNNSGGGWWGSNNSLPWPAPLWLGTNALTDYYPNANYKDSAYFFAGRVPYIVTASNTTTGNTLSNLMTTANCPAGWASVDPWWNNWKDHLFYALSQEFQPTSNGGQSCGNWHAQCLSINNAGHYAAVVMFAGPRLSALNQTRANKSVITDYLETPNGTNFTGASGNENYTTGVASSTFNDVLYCIKEDLSVIQCP
jgi:hypothetical protein